MKLSAHGLKGTHNFSQKENKTTTETRENLQKPKDNNMSAFIYGSNLSYMEKSDPIGSDILMKGCPPDPFQSRKNSHTQNLKSSIDTPHNQSKERGEIRAEAYKSIQEDEGDSVDGEMALEDNTVRTSSLP